MINLSNHYYFSKLYFNTFMRLSLCLLPSTPIDIRGEVIQIVYMYPIFRREGPMGLHRVRTPCIVWLSFTYYLSRWYILSTRIICISFWCLPLTLYRLELFSNQECWGWAIWPFQCLFYFIIFSPLKSDFFHNFFYWLIGVLYYIQEKSRSLRV